MRVQGWFPSVALLICTGPAAIAGEWDVTALAAWPVTSRLTAARLIEEFGLPDRHNPKRLLWLEKGPWKRITLWNTASAYGRPDADDLEETVAYRVPTEKLHDLADFSKTVRVSEEGTLLSARSASEELNFLELNLSHEIITGKLGPAQARAVYAKTLRLAAAGKSSALLRGLSFSPTAAPRPGWPLRFSAGRDPMLRDPLWKNEPSTDPR